MENGTLKAPNSIPGSAATAAKGKGNSTNGRFKNDILAHMIMLGKAEIFEDLHMIKLKKTKA